MSNLRTWRKTQGLTLEQLGAQLNTTPTSISRYERGERIPAPGMMRAIIAATQGAVTPSDFYALSEEKDAA